MKTTIGIIDDHKIVRQGLKELLEKLGNYQVINEFESGKEFLEALPLSQIPDVLILDYSMPEFNGIEILKKMEDYSEYKFLLLTQHLDEQTIDDAYHFGARGFLHKNCTAHDLKFAIDNIKNVGYNNVSEILKRIKNYSESQSTPHISVQLSERELRFLELICDENEYTYDQIADLMGISIKTVEVCRTMLFDRYNIKSKVGLVLFSFKHKLTKPFI